ncbi:Hsp20/alpha crystallin family protein [Robertmurraya yapensis]|uniref:Hsp20/alpha crystallin family protein n=2 Tax=Bacillus yapensis TaxID=2492960 RepID=A0A431W6S8_9BACI|nr:Hsp20/alpha crystallin family protein [Bacillus yapensis]RTR31048.1 Hsp20/alpha crystallin family protein [Bacillus yapensis]TKS95477.1 Hsp20/alpha crystallin family protein [Bacillus yapensis]
MFPWNFSPFNKETMQKLKRMRPEEVENYVSEVMGKMFPPEMQGMNFTKGFNSSTEESSPSLSVSVFESLDYVYVMIPINNEDWLQKMKLYYTSNQLIIEHIPEPEDKQTITLPAIVRKKGSRATYKDGTLEIKIPKNIDMQYSEIDITEKY